MRRLRIILFALLGIVIIIGVFLYAVGYFKPKGAGLLIETDPTSTIYINGEQVGRTSYEGVFDPGEVIVKLIPDSVDTPLAPYETKVRLVSGIQTAIKRKFGETEETSSGITISFEEIGGKETSLAVVSLPDNAQVEIDGSIRGFAPYKTSSVTAGEHILTVLAPGFNERTLGIKAVEGYKLTVVVKLSPNGEETKEEEKPEEENPKEEIKEVEILSTPNNFLRVRSGPGTSYDEVGRVTPGQKYQYLKIDEDTGWYQIEYEEGSKGWVSGDYVKIVEETSDS